MKTLVALLIAAVLFAGFGVCQERFEVASIAPCKPGTPAAPIDHAGMAKYIFPGGRFNVTAVTLKTLFEWAYTIQPEQHSSGPSWLDTDLYDVVAKAAGQPDDAAMKLMLQSLLAARFQLRFHREHRNMTVLAMTVGKTAPKLLAPKDGEAQSLHVIQQPGPDQKIASYRVVATRFPLSQLTDTLARQLDRIVVNETGLAGEFDFQVDLTPDDSQGNPVDPSLLITAMREQLGIDFKSGNASVDYYVIESAQ